MNEPQEESNSMAIDPMDDFAPDNLFDDDDELTDLSPENWDCADLDLFSIDHEEGEDDEADFFAENKEESELEDHMKDYFLEYIHGEMDKKMTAHDFERSQFDVHGISQPVDENPEMISKSLQYLDVEIARLKGEGGNRSESYRLAEAQNEQFVSDRSFRLKFLRCENFEIQAAASRLLSFFDLKLELWGLEKLAKKITLLDLEEYGSEAIENGHMQLLPVRDLAGRSIIFNNMNHIKYKDPMNVLRTAFYLAMTAIEDEETQKNGLSFIQYKIGEQRGMRPTRQLLWKGAFAHRAFPVRVASVHVCFGRQSLPFVRLLKYALEYQTSHRVRVHEGSQSECLNKLMTFGIQRYAIPLSSNGDMTTSYHMDWLAKRRISEALKKEEELASACGTQPNSRNVPDAPDGVLLPSQHDILLGRGKRAQHHPGNNRLHLLLEEKFEEFDKGNRKKKREVAFFLINSVKQRGGRFLEKGEGIYWSEVSDEIARKKIAHDFRTTRQRLSGKSGGVTGNARRGKRGASAEDSLVSLPKGKRLGLSRDY